MFSPSIFARESDHHIVSKQPTSEQEIEESRAALAACPVAELNNTMTAMAMAMAMAMVRIH